MRSPRFGYEFEIKAVCHFLRDCRSSYEFSHPFLSKLWRYSCSLIGHLSFSQFCWLLSLEWLTTFEHCHINPTSFEHVSFWCSILEPYQNHIPLKHRCLVESDNRTRPYIYIICYHGLHNSLYESILTKFSKHTFLNKLEANFNKVGAHMFSLSPI